MLGGGLFSNPGIDISLDNIGSGNAATINDHWEFYLTATSASGISGASDSVTFANKAFSGDGEVTALVESMANMAAGGYLFLLVIPARRLASIEATSLLRSR